MKCRKLYSGSEEKIVINNWKCLTPWELQTLKQHKTKITIINNTTAHYSSKVSMVDTTPQWMIILVDDGGAGQIRCCTMPNWV